MDEDKEKYELLRVAIKNNNIFESIKLISTMTNEQLMARFSRRNTILHYACIHKNLTIAAIIIERVPTEHIFVQNIYGITPLHYIIHSSGMEARSIIWLLLEKLPPGKINLADDIDGKTPLHTIVDTIAFENSPFENMVMLLEKLTNEEINYGDENGNRPVHWAATGNDTQTINALVDRLFEDQLSIPDYHGNTVLHLVVKNDNIESAKYILNKMRLTDRVIRNEDGKTAFQLATSKEMKQLLQPVTKSAIY